MEISFLATRMNYLVLVCIFALLLVVSDSQSSSSSISPSQTGSVTSSRTQSVGYTSTETPSRSYYPSQTGTQTISPPGQSPQPSTSPSSTPSKSKPGACQPTVITGLSPNNNVTVWGSTKGKLSAPNSECGFRNSGVAWYSVIPSPSTNVTAETCSTVTNFDTVIGIYIGKDCENLQCVTYNDDACGTGQSRIQWTADGDIYYIGVAGYDRSFGTFQLTLSVSG